MSDTNKEKEIILPLEWDVPEGIVARYATNMVVQRAENEFIISFFEVKPPLILGNPDQIAEQAKKLKSIRAICVAQIIVAADKMPSFVEALQKTIKKPTVSDGKEE